MVSALARVRNVCKTKKLHVAVLLTTIAAVAHLCYRSWPWVVRTTGAIARRPAFVSEWAVRQRLDDRTLRGAEDDMSLADSEHALAFANECLHVSNLHTCTDQNLVELPPDVNQHYEEMLKKTAPWRDFEQHSYAGYRGPWIENLWIERFCCDLPQSYFGVYVPLFVQWTDFTVAHQDMSDLYEMLTRELRDDVRYITVSQHDEGPFLEDLAATPELFKRVLVLQAGGVGHVPIPLLKGELELLPINRLPLSVPTAKLNPKSAPYLLSFAGNDNRSYRRELFGNIDEALKSRELPTIFRYLGGHWIDVVQDSIFNLCPRGTGATSFRLFELLQMGAIPIVIWGPELWLPYKSSIPWNDMILQLEWQPHHDVENKQRVDQLLNQMEELLARPEKIEQMRATIRKFRDSHFTARATLSQIGKFLNTSALTQLDNSQAVSTREKQTDYTNLWTWNDQRTSISSGNITVETMSDLNCEQLSKCFHVSGKQECQWSVDTVRQWGE